MEKLSLGSFSIVGRLSEGPLGVLYEGTHGTTHDRVVVRVFPAALTRDPGALSRLQALQRALSRLEPERSVAVQRPSGRDPAIPTVIECGRLPDGALYIATEFVAGESLAVGLRRHSGLPLPNKALRLGRQLSACLAVAHSSGIRHLGLRPDKVLLAHVAGSGDADHVRVLDLGLYDALGYRPRLSDLPPHEQSYLAPEQRREDGAVGPEADVFALGVILYEMGSGGLPPGSRQRGASLPGAQQTSLMQMLPSWLQPFAQLLERMLEPEPSARPSMSHVAATLQQLSALVPGSSASSLPPSSSTPKMPTALPASAVSRPPVAAAPPGAVPPMNEAATQPPASLPPPRPATPSSPASSTAETVPPAASPPEELTPTGATVRRRGKDGPRAPGSPSPPATPVTAKPLPPGAPKPVGPPSPPAAKAPPAPAPSEGDGEIEIEADYTMSSSPRGKRGKAADSLAHGPTHLSDPELPASEASIETAVEPGVGNTVTLKPGDLVGNFRITAKIGQGGMGAVYAAVHQQIGRRAAVKVLHGALGRTADYAQRFINEARAVNLLRHPSLVEIFDFGRLSDGTLYLIMEFLEGESLRALVRRKRVLGEDVAKDYAYQIAQAFALAHQKGIIHRDIKPANLFLENNGNLKILDFGIARSVEQNAAESGDVRVLGTPYYMAPELLNAEPVDLRADVYALGLTAFHLLTGRPPFISDTPFGVASMQLTEPLPDPRTLAAGLPEDLCWLIERMAEKDRSTRIQSCDEVVRLLGLPPPELSALSQSTSQAALPVRSPWILAIAALLLGALALAGALMMR